jgi:DNA-directed RNA polymerase subunit alpha
LTVGNALRRVLLSALEGYNICSYWRCRSWVFYYFRSCWRRYRNILNLKQVRFKRQIEDIDNESVTISVSGKSVNSWWFSKFISGFQVLNPELVICNLDSKIKLNFDLTIEKVEDSCWRNKKQNAAIGTILQILFLLCKNVKYAIENFRVEQKTDYEN